MATTIVPSHQFRAELRRRGGENAARCMQCATCSAVCELAPEDGPYPRRQMLMAQWGLAERLAGDPAVWLCHQCGECSLRCPRDVQPAAVMQAVRSLTIEQLAVPRAMGRLVGNAGRTWPLLLGVPLLFWALLTFAVGGFGLGEAVHGYEDVVPHWLLYAVFFPVAGWVLAVTVASGRRFWKLLGENGAPRRGSFLASLAAVAGEIGTHGRFGSCQHAASRRFGHLALFWGFVGAAVTSGLLIVWMYGFGAQMPLAQGHPVKILGNLSAVLLVVGVALLTLNRFTDPKRVGPTRAFDRFFLGVVLGVIATGVLVEVVRLMAVPPVVAASLYVLHLGVILCLFTTFPYSKFAHMVYRTLAMTHERMTAPAEIAAPQPASQPAPAA